MRDDVPEDVKEALRPFVRCTAGWDRRGYGGPLVYDCNHTVIKVCREALALQRLEDVVRAYRAVGADAPGTWALWEELDRIDALRAAGVRHDT